METWLLQSRKGGRTCGHLHVAEAEAWRCLDAQAEPAAWSVASAWLAVKDERPQRDVEYVLLLWGWVVLMPLGAVLSVVVLVLSAVALVAGMGIQAREVAIAGVLAAAVGLSFCVPASLYAVKWFRKEIGRPRILGWMSRGRLAGEAR